jgi:hypothetical protein
MKNFGHLEGRPRRVTFQLPPDASNGDEKIDAELLELNAFAVLNVEYVREYALEFLRCSGGCVKLEPKLLKCPQKSTELVVNDLLRQAGDDFRRRHAERQRNARQALKDDPLQRRVGYHFGEVVAFNGKYALGRVQLDEQFREMRKARERDGSKPCLKLI